MQSTGLHLSYERNVVSLHVYDVNKQYKDTTGRQPRGLLYTHFATWQFPEDCEIRIQNMCAGACYDFYI